MGQMTPVPLSVGQRPLGVGQRTPTPLKRYLAAIEEKEGALKWNLTPLGTPQELKDRSDVMKVLSLWWLLLLLLLWQLVC